MSINITVNGKYAKHCKPHPLLLDPVKSKKEEEEERRKVRLLQVREQSKRFAEKIRNDVKESMRKEKQKFEATKAEEFNCWRHHALQEKMHDYRTAVFQIGTAHMAAKNENKEQAEKKEAKKQATYKQFRKKMAARQKNKENLLNRGPCICSKIHVCPNAQFQCTCGQPEIQRVEEPQKRKRNSCFSSCDSESSTDDETSNGKTLDDSSISSCVIPSATTVSSCHNRATQTSLHGTSNNLKKTPAVFLDVEVGSEDSIVITGPTEVKDMHSEYNQQYSSIIRVSPRKARKTQENKLIQVTRTTSVSSEPSTEKIQEIRKPSEDNSKGKGQPIARAVREKRFTLISDLVKKQQNHSIHPVTTSPTRRQESVDSHSRTSPCKHRDATLTTMRPRSTSQPITPKASPRKGSASSKSSQFVAGSQKRGSVSLSAASGANTLALGSSSSTSGRVQFYDYNSKFSKDGVQEQTNVTVNRQRETLQPSAMEQAVIENRLQQERHQDMLDKNKQMEERGHKALEREQVRRDCNDLNEKLEALTRQYPLQLPTNDNPPHIFVDKQLRKEGKMNTAVENLLSRPNIITCSEVSQKKVENDNTTSKPFSVNNFCNEINVGLPSNISQLPTKDVSSDSCCSILLGYVDDQSRQVRRDLEEWPYTERNEKQTRLKNLLLRLDKMRESLMQELKIAQKDAKGNGQTSSKNEQFGNLIDCISKCRQEREDIMIDSIVQKEQTDKETRQREDKGKDKRKGMYHTIKEQARKKDSRPLDEREKVLQLKEDLLEKKLREFYDLQKQQNKQIPSKEKGSDSEEQMENIINTDQLENKENINCTSLETPVEIVITVKGESKCITIPGKSKRKTPSKRKPTQRATLLKSPQPAKKLTPRKKPPVTKQAPGKVLGRQNSYDSNSTSYMSLPAQIPNELGNLVDNLQQQIPHSTTEDTQTSLEFDEGNESSHSKTVQHINPLVAQYIQRLLGMSRKAVQRLGVSSSEIDTPSSSIINTSGNVVSQDSVVSDERMALVESFMQENRSFIKELEQSLRANNNSTMDNSTKVLDDIWRKRLKQQKKQAENMIKPKHKSATNLPSNRKSNPENQIHAKEKTLLGKHQSKDMKSNKNRDQRKVNVKSSQQRPLLDTKTPLSRKKSTEVCRDDFDSSPELLATEKRALHHNPAETKDKAVGTGISVDLNKPEADSQIARYAQLTENCTHRIAELTELISRVRQEKQRLLEVTLSSVSDNGRQSTEYLELPNGKVHTINEPAETSATSSSDDALQNKKSTTLEITAQMPKLSALEKNRHIAASQDSGIAESRPITAQENRNDVEPISHNSTESHVSVNTHQRKLKPPPALRRFSPQFREDELAHELSTIIEVDTPANSRINTAVGQTSSEDRVAAVEPLKHPAMFPNFREYVQHLNLDITQLGAEESAQLHQEFYLYIEDLQKSRMLENHQYTAFPSINAYIGSTKAEHGQPDTIDESLGQMRINSIPFERFPDVRGYVQQQRNNPATITSPNDDPQLLDTESLENITDLPTNSNTDNDTASLDIEQELKRRNILKKSFRYTQSKQIFSSTAHQDGEFYNEIIAAESGLEKLSTSGNTLTLPETNIKRLVRQWPTGAKNKGKQQYQTPSSTTTSTKETTKDKDLKSTSLEESLTELGRPLNLKDFLKRELLKHANISDSTTSSSSDFSLRSQFLYSLIGTLTPCTNGATSKSGQHTLDRQKTSTPVPIQSSNTQSTPRDRSRASSSQLFSGESRISSVHLHDRSNRLQNTSEGVNGDQSSN